MPRRAAAAVAAATLFAGVILGSTGCGDSASPDHETPKSSLGGAKPDTTTEAPATEPESQVYP